MQDKTIKYKLTFSKKAEMVYISHLDLMTLFRRAIRRAKLPYFLTEGFSPRVKISIPKALKLGVPSDNEEMNLWLKEDRDIDNMRAVLNTQLPSGIEITSVAREN